MLRINHTHSRTLPHSAAVLFSRAEYSLLLPVSTAHQTWHLSGIWELCRVIQTSALSPAAFCYLKPLPNAFLFLISPHSLSSLCCVSYSPPHLEHIISSFLVGLSPSLCGEHHFFPILPVFKRRTPATRNIPFATLSQMSFCFCFAS